MPQQVCRLVEDYDEKQEGNRRWEARMVTPQGEKVISKVEFWSEYYKTRGWLASWRHTFSGESQAQFEKKFREYEEASSGALAQLVAQLMQDGWQVATSDSHGRVTLMKR